MPVPQINLFQRLNPVTAAAYNAGPRAGSQCFKGTRVKVCDNITQWADNPSDLCMAWLHGPAGFGKSAIARTMAHIWAKGGRLIGSFFFFRNSGNQSKAACLMPTLAHDVSISIPETKVEIEKALRHDPGLFDRAIEVQLQKLIVGPIVAALAGKPPGLPWLIVVDGLDECDDIEPVKQLVAAIASFDLSNFPVAFFFTSRMEEYIRIIFHSEAIKSITHKLSLSDFSSSNDVQLFLEKRFSEIHDEHIRYMGQIPRPWPAQSDLTHIVEIVNGSFIFAATLAEYVRGGKPPPKRLVPILKTHTGVDGMYKEILSAFWDKDRFQTVFSTVILLTRPLSINGLEFLLPYPEGEVLYDILDICSTSRRLL